MIPACFSPATPADLPRLHRAMVDFYSHEGLSLDAGVITALETLLATPSYGQVYVIEPPAPAWDGSPPVPSSPAQPQAQPVGYLVLTYGYSLEFQGRTALLDELYLPSAHRGQGLGTQALEFVIQTCRDQGIHLLFLEARPENIKAQALYERLGFRKNDRDIMLRRL